MGNLSEQEQENRVSQQADVAIRKMLDKLAEDNKLIAEFMGTLKKMYKDNFGGQVYYNPADENDRHSEMYTNQFKYHTSWDWLIPVVEKIKYCMNYNMSIRDVEEALLTTKISVVYLTVVEFIKWYNKNKEDQL